MKLKSIILRADTPTANGNIYPKQLLERIVRDSQPLIVNKRMFGVVGMPPEDHVNLEDVSHIVTKLEMVGNDMVGEVEIVEGTYAGNIILDLLNGGGEFVLRPSGIASKLKDDIVSDDYTLISINIVRKEDAA